MTPISLLISPAAKGAYYHDYLKVAEAELKHTLDTEFTHKRMGNLEFFEFDADAEIFPRLMRLSFAQGIFERSNGFLKPLDASSIFALHEDFVFGSKYKGKTHELLTQMLINLGLNALGHPKPSTVKLLDPMAGRGTTLLWAMRYGLVSRGIEQDITALPELHRHLKKWSKVHRQKHKLNEGFVVKANKQQRGKFLEFSAEDTRFQLVTGDSADAQELLAKETFHLVVSDLPYGIQHFTTHKTRNPSGVLALCAPAWEKCLKPGGVMVLAFNRNNPKRKDLLALFEEQGLVDTGFLAPHRMSESIVRDILVLQKPG